MISFIDRKYFLLAVGSTKLKKDTPNEISCNCPSCGDTKNRLHLVYVSDGDYSYVKCFNSGCFFEEPTTVYKLLQLVAPEYISQYKRETLNNKIDDIKAESSLDGILEKIQSKTKSVTEPKKELPLDSLFMKCKDSEECVKYIKSRGFEPYDNWYFSKDKYFKYENKNVFLENYLIIPIIDNNDKYRGFYSRNIYKKEFSTFLLPDTEKIWIKNPTRKPDIIAEGIFDSLSSGFDNPAAMLGAELNDEYRKSLSKMTIFAFDNDETGIQKAIKYSKFGFNVFVWPNELDYFKDLNELKQAGVVDIKETITQNTFSGILAETRLRMKDK